MRIDQIFNVPGTFATYYGAKSIHFRGFWYEIVFPRILEPADVFS